MTPIETLEVRSALSRFARGDIAPTRLMRALAAHDAWLVPAGLLAVEEAPADPADTLVIGDPGANSAETVHLFTDLDAAEAATQANHDLGRFATGIPGARALAVLSPRFESLEINLGSPDEQRWSVRHRYFPMLRLWAQTVAVERLLNSCREAGERRAAVADYPAWLVLAEPDRRTPKAVHLADREGSWALAFTASDQLKACQAPDCPEVVFQARFRGDQLIDALRELGFAGLVVNPADQAVTVSVSDS